MAEGRANRFYQNPSLRDDEWNRAKQVPMWVTVLAMAIVGVGFFMGVYADAPQSTVGWIVGLITLILYGILTEVRRRQARRELREAHARAMAQSQAS